MKPVKLLRPSAGTWNSQSSEPCSSAMNPSMLTAVLYCVSVMPTPSLAPLTFSSDEAGDVAPGVRLRLVLVAADRDLDQPVRPVAA